MRNCVLLAAVWWASTAPAALAQTSDLLGVFGRTPENFTLDMIAVAFDGRSTSVPLAASERLPGAAGDAKVSRRPGVTEVAVRLDHMKPAWSFGGDFNTYILWALSPEGEADNLGEFILRGNSAELNASTPLDVFGLIVSAEPHFLVHSPSPFIVLSNREPDRAEGRAPQPVRLQLPGPDPSYRFEIDTLAAAPEVEDEVRSFLRQAHVALQLAERAGAARLFPDAFAQAMESLQRTEGAAETRSATHPDVEMMARRTIRYAARAHALAMGGSPPRAETPRSADAAGSQTPSEPAPIWFRLDAIP